METSISRTSAQSFKCQCKMVAKLGKCVFLVPKRFPVPKKYYDMSKIQIFNFHRFLPRYWPNPESLVTIGQMDLSPQILGPKFPQYLQGPKIEFGPNKKITPRDNPKDARNIKIQTEKSPMGWNLCLKVSEKNTPKYPQKRGWGWGVGAIKKKFL